MSGFAGTPAVVFGGTFDPVHHGHLRAAWEAREVLGTTDFRFMPAGTPPHRQEQVSAAEHRLEMLRLALPPDSGFVIDRRELERAGPSFMVDTLRELRSEREEAPILLLIGQDSANGLDGWHEWRELFELAHIAVMSRAGDILRYSNRLQEEVEARRTSSPADLLRELSGRWISVQVSSLTISSSRIRQIVASGRSPRFLTPDPVLEYIERHGLYADPTG